MAEVTAIELAALQQGMNDRQRMLFMTQYAADKKDRTLALVLSILGGMLGVDRFYVNDIAIGVLKLLTGGVCGILYIIDFFLIMGAADAYNRQKAYDIAATVKTLWPA